MFFHFLPDALFFFCMKTRARNVGEHSDGMEVLPKVAQSDGTSALEGVNAAHRNCLRCTLPALAHYMGMLGLVCTPFSAKCKGLFSCVFPHTIY